MKDAYLSIDFGNSSTRMSVIYGDLKPIHKTISNRYGYITQDKMHLLESSQYTEKNSKVFRLGDKVVCLGKICSNEIGKNAIKPTATDKKYDSKFTRYALRAVLMEAYQHISDRTSIPVEELDIKWHIAVCIPAFDMQYGREKMQDLVLEVDEINFMIPNVSKKIVMDRKVMVRPEGSMAYMGVLFENRRLYRSGMKEVSTKNTLVIDMGDGTTDLCIVCKSDSSQSSLHSIAKGGSTITNNLKKEMEQEYGRPFSLDAMQEASLTGVLKIGNREKDITTEVERIRQSVAVNVVNEIKGYFDTANFNIDEINYILLCGGGAISQENSGMRSYESYVKEELHSMMAYADFLEMPFVATGEDKVTGPLSPRMLNVVGLSILNSPTTSK